MHYTIQFVAWKWYISNIEYFIYNNNIISIIYIHKILTKIFIFQTFFTMTQSTTFEALFQDLCNGDRKRLINCLEAYTEDCKDEEIVQIDYNPSSGYAFVALENGISICEAFNGIEYLTTNFDTGEETFSETYEEAQATLK